MRRYTRKVVLLIITLFSLLNVTLKYKPRINLVTSLPIDPLFNLLECVRVSIENGKFCSLKIDIYSSSLVFSSMIIYKM